jgi:hypothetical protein
MQSVGRRRRRLVDRAEATLDAFFRFREASSGLKDYRQFLVDNADGVATANPASNRRSRPSAPADGTVIELRCAESRGVSTGQTFAIFRPKQ